jgi:hypothetical protein
VVYAAHHQCCPHVRQVALVVVDAIIHLMSSVREDAPQPNHKQQQQQQQAKEALALRLEPATQKR